VSFQPVTLLLTTRCDIKYKMSPQPTDGIDITTIGDPGHELYRLRKASSDSCDSADLGVSMTCSTGSVSEESVDLDLPEIKVGSAEFTYDEESFYDGADNSDNDQNRADSGVEVEKEHTPDFVAPDIELSQRIVDQVEYYFSDESIMKDAFLLKHVRRNKEGFVSLKLIASFKKVKHLSKDWRVIAYALQESDALEINEQSTKIRRQQPLPEFDETTHSRSVIAINLPLEKPSVENVSQLFKDCGDIALVRILKPGTSMPNEVRQVLNKQQVQIEKDVCAVIEFEKSESAREALSKMNGKNGDWRSQTMVMALMKPNKKSNNKKTTKKTEDVSQPKEAEKEPAQPDSRRRKPKKQSKNKTRRDSQTDSCNQKFYQSSESSMSVSPVNNYIASHRLLSQSTSAGNLPLRSKSNSISGTDSPYAPGSWRQRRFGVSTNDYGSDWRKQDATSSSSNPASVNVVRLPRGPDGTKGFFPNSRLPKSRSVSLPMPIPSTL